MVHTPAEKYLSHLINPNSPDKLSNRSVKLGIVLDKSSATIVTIHNKGNILNTLFFEK